MNNKELIEFVFYHEKEIKQAVFERREDGCLPKTGGGSSGHCRIPDTTAQNAIRRVMGVGSVVVEYGAATCGRRNSVTIRHPEKWLQTISGVRQILNGRPAGTLLKLRYTDNLTPPEICDAMHINKPRYYALKADVLLAAESYATGLGLLNARH